MDYTEKELTAIYHALKLYEVDNADISVEKEKKDLQRIIKKTLFKISVFKRAEDILNIQNTDIKNIIK